MNNRCYLRGWSLLGLFDTVIGCLFNRVLVRHIDVDTGKTVKWSWGIADEHHPVYWIGSAKFEIHCRQVPYRYDETGKPIVIALAAETLNEAYTETRRLAEEHARELGDDITTATHIRYFIIFFQRNGITLEEWRLEDNRAETQGA